MGSPNEPPRKIDLKKWDATWERIRANQAKQRAEAAAAELRAGIDIQPEDLSPEHITNLHDAEAEAAAPTMPEHLPPLPPSTRYGGVLDDYDGPVSGYTCDPDDGLRWVYSDHWVGMQNEPRRGCPDAQWSGLWHVAIPVDEQS